MLSLIPHSCAILLLFLRFSTGRSTGVLFDASSDKRDGETLRRSAEETEPIALDLDWKISDAFNGLFTVNISVGTPAQRQQLVLDTESSDGFLHWAGDEQFLKACSVQTPSPTCWSTCKYNAKYSAMTIYCFISSVPDGDSCIQTSTQER